MRRARLTNSRALFVSHEASRTGAPRVLVYVMESLPEVRGAASLKGEGPLEEEFAALANSVYVRPGRLARWAVGRLRLFSIPYFAQIFDQLFAIITIVRTKVDLVYINSVVAADYVRPGVWLRKRVILHCHELEPTLTQVLSGYRLRKLSTRFELVACGSAVAEQLRELMGPKVTIHLLHEPVDVARVRQAGQGDLKEGLGDVVACGTVDHRKGADLWVEAIVAARRTGLDADVKFTWIGTGPLLDEMRRRVEALGLADTIEFMGEIANPHPYIARSSVVMVPSRVDPFPLVTLEAMALEKPVIAFEVGGLSEQLGDTGVLIDPFDTDAMGASIVNLLTDEDRRRRLGSESHARVKSLYDIARFRKQVRAIVLGNGNRSLAETPLS